MAKSSVSAASMNRYSMSPAYNSMGIEKVDQYGYYIPDIPTDTRLDFTELNLGNIHFPTEDQILNLIHQPFQIEITLPIAHMIYAVLAGHPLDEKSSYIRHRAWKTWKFNNWNITDDPAIYNSARVILKSKKTPMVVCVDASIYHGYEYVVIPPWHKKDVYKLRREFNIIETPAIS